MNTRIEKTEGQGASTGGYRLVFSRAGEVLRTGFLFLLLLLALTPVGGHASALAAAPTISAITTIAGGAAKGGTASAVALTLTGTDLSGTTDVSFSAGGITRSATRLFVVDASTITFNAPVWPAFAGTSQAVTVTVTTPGGAASRVNGFTYTQPVPTITSVAATAGGPAEGGINSGVSLKVTGSNFITGATTVAFRSGSTTVAATNVSVSGGVITFSAPIWPVFAGSSLSVDVVVTTPGGSATSAGAFTYQHVDPTFTSLQLSGGGAAAGGVTEEVALTATGTGFRPGTTVVFGPPGSQYAATSVVVVNDTTLTLKAPAFVNISVPTRTFPVTVRTPLGEATLNNAFTYSQLNPTITSITPNSGIDMGGTSVVITGTNFDRLRLVRFNSAAGTIIRSNSTEIQLTTPRKAAGRLDVTVVTDLGWATASSGFTFNPTPPTLQYLDPRTVSTAGGPVSVYGFSNMWNRPATVTVDGVRVVIDEMNSGSGSIRFTAPARATPGPVDVTVIAPGGNATLTNALLYVGAPATVTSIAPDKGLLAARPTIRLTGTGLWAPPSYASGPAPAVPPISVTIGGVAATGVTAAPDGQSITATVPVGAALGPVDVVVVTPSGTVTLPGGYRYVPPAPVISGVTAAYMPAKGPIDGNADFTITGSNLAGATVTFDGLAATNVSVAADGLSLTGKTPAHAAGAVSVAVTTDGGTATLANGYTFVAAPTVPVMDSDWGPLTGRTVTATGTNLANATVWLDGRQVTTTVLAGGTSVQFSSGTHAAGTVSVEIRTPGGSVIVPGGYTYRPVPVVTSASPAGDNIAGGRLITITGQNLQRLNIGIRSVTIAAAQVSDDGTTATFTAPGGAAGSAPMTFSTPGGPATGTFTFTWRDTPGITAMDTVSGPVAGGTVVALLGPDLSGATVTVDGQPATNATNLLPPRQGWQIVMPPHAAGPVTIALTTFGGTATRIFTYFDPPEITAVAPASGPQLGGVPLVITGRNLDGATLSFDGVTSTPTVTDGGTRIAFTPPAHSIGTVALSMTTPGGTSSWAGGYTYVPRPKVTEITPNRGSLAGGQVELAGMNLADAVVAVDSQEVATTPTPTGLRFAVPSRATAGAVPVSVTTPGGTANVNPGYTYVDAPVIDTMDLKRGPLAGGTTITFTGSHLEDATLDVGGQSPAATVTNSGTKLQFTTPAHVAETVSVTVTTPGGQATAADRFTYVAPPVLSGIAPATGPVDGGGTVTLQGQNLDGARVAVDGNTVATVTNDGTTLTFIAPAHDESAPPAAVAVSVTTDGGSASAPGGYLYRRSPAIDSVTPNEGSSAGGTAVVLRGSNLFGATVTVDGRGVASPVFDSATGSLSFTMPAHAEGLATVAVSHGGGTASTTFTYFEGPRIARISQPSDPVAGGTVLTFTGERLARATLSFDGATSTPTVSADGTSFTFTTPGHAAGTVGVRVSTPFGSQDIAGGYTYVDPPSVTNIDPAFGPLTDGQSVRLTGANLNDAQLTLDGQALASTVTDGGTHLAFTAPRHAAGTVAVAVTTPGGAADVTGGYTYLAPPVITSLDISSGPVTGNTLVTVTGQNLDRASLVFGGQSPAATITDGGTKLTFRTPVHTAGAVDLSVTTPGGLTSLSSAFTYVAAPIVSSISPAAGPVTGGGAITLGGQYLANAIVTVDSQSVAVTVDPGGRRLSFTAPAHLAGPVTVNVRTAGGSLDVAGGYTYWNIPSISDIRPAAGPRAGGTDVTLIGQNLQGVTLTIGGQPVNAPQIAPDGTSLTFTTPAQPAGPASVVVSDPGGTATANFTFRNAPGLSVSRARGPSAGGTLLTFTGAELDGTTLTFDGVATRPAVTNGGTSFTYTTAAHAAGTVAVSAETAGGTATLAGGYTFVDAPVARIDKSEGPADGGTEITVTGSSLEGLTVTFGGQAITPVVTDDTTFKFTTPRDAAGTVSLVIQATGGTVTLADCFRYIAAPNGVRMSAIRGTVDGGTLVTVTGDNLANARLIFDSVESLPVVAADGKSFSFTTPPHARGRVRVSVSTAGGSVQLEDFVFAGPPSIVQLTPPNGPTTGRTPVTITGVDLADATVTLDGKPIATTSGADGSLTLTTPARHQGAVDLSIHTPFGDTTLAGGFTYDLAPAIQMLDTTSGYTRGGTRVTLHGHDLMGATAVTFGAVEAVIEAVDPEGEWLTVTTPASRSGGAVKVAVVLPSGTIVSPAAFTYVVPAPLDLQPGSGALPDAVAGRSYSVTLTGSGGLGPYRYALTNGTLPAGLTFDPATAVISGTVDPDAAAETAFTIVITDSEDSRVSRDYTLVVRPFALTAANQSVLVAGGTQPEDLDLTDGSVGGPFARAEIQELVPSNAGSASLLETNGSAGTRLHFETNPRFSGQARLLYRLISSRGATNWATVTYTIRVDRQLVISETTRRVTSFIDNRQAMLAEAVDTPGLIEARARGVETTGSINVDPSDEGLKARFAMEKPISAGDDLSPMMVWAKGTAMLNRHRQESAENPKDVWGNLQLFTAGVDLEINPHALVGLVFAYHRMSDPVDLDTQITGNGWLAGPYASVEPMHNVFLDAKLLYGQSTNQITTDMASGSFSTRMLMANATLRGQMEFQGGTTLSPRMKLSYMREQVGDFDMQANDGEIVPVPGFDRAQMRGSLGFDLRHAYLLDDALLVTPMLTADIGYAGLDGSGLFATINPGVSITTQSGWMLTGGIMTQFAASGDYSMGLKGSINRTF